MAKRKPNKRWRLMLLVVGAIAVFMGVLILKYNVELQKSVIDLSSSLGLEKLELPNLSNPLDPEQQKVNDLKKQLVLANQNYRPDAMQQLNFSAWLPVWAGTAGSRSLKALPDNFNSISPMWYEVNADGSLRKINSDQAEIVKTETKKKKIALIPTVALFDHNLLGQIMSDPTKFNTHINSITAQVEQFNYDGIDLDYESMRLIDKDKYFEFLQELSKRLHSKNRLLIVTVIAKTTDNIQIGSFRETKQVQDWTRISFFADYIRIMAYDYTFQGSANPGPIAPLDWQTELLDYAVTVIPRQKIVLGLHLYSYEWWQKKADLDAQRDNPKFQDPLKFKSNPSEQVEPAAYNFDDDPDLELTPQKSRSYTYSVVKKVLTDNKSKGKLESYQGEQIFRYSKLNPASGAVEERVLVFIDPDGVKARVKLAQNYGISGIVFWRLGGEDDLLKNL